MRTVGMGVSSKREEDKKLLAEITDLKAENVALKQEITDLKAKKVPQKDQGRRSGSRRRVKTEGAVCLT